MKYFLLLLCTLPLLTFIACDNELEPFETGQDIPIVYGFLNVLDTAHYIRVEKAFLDEEASPQDIAQIADSLYYDESLLVQIEDIEFDQRFTLERVDGNQEGYVRESGTFADAPNILYKLKFEDGQQLRADADYQLIIDRGGDLPIVTATTKTIGNIDFRNPNSVFSETINFLNDNLEVAWEHPSQAELFDVYLIFNYLEETEAGSGNYEVKTFRTRLRRNVRAEGNNSNITSVDVDGNQLFRDLGAALSPGPDRDILLDDYTGFEIIAGGQELGAYFDLLDLNSGLTSAEVTPVYTNLSEGLGIFTSRFVQNEIAFKLSSRGIDSLRFGQFTRDLGF